VVGLLGPLVGVTVQDGSGAACLEEIANEKAGGRAEGGTRARTSDANPGHPAERSSGLSIPDHDLFQGRQLPVKRIRRAERAKARAAAGRSAERRLTAAIRGADNPGLGFARKCENWLRQMLPMPLLAFGRAIKL